MIIPFIKEYTSHMPPLNQKTRLTAAAADIYLLTSGFALSIGTLSWDQYLLRLRFLRDNSEPGSLQGDATHQILVSEDSDGEEEWPLGGPEQSGTEPDPSDSQVSKDAETELLHFCAAGSTGLSQWLFHQADPDFFPSIPHGHWSAEKRKKLDAYRGWVYREDEQIDREPRWKIIALWNDEKFRAFAATAIGYYLSSFPRYGWRVPNPMRLPRRR